MTYTVPCPACHDLSESDAVDTMTATAVDALYADNVTVELVYVRDPLMCGDSPDEYDVESVTPTCAHTLTAAQEETAIRAAIDKAEEDRPRRRR